MTTTSTSYLRAATGPAGPDHRGGHRRRPFVIAAVVVTVLVLAAVWVIAFSSVFGVRTVEVKGAGSVSAASVRAAAHVSHGSPLIRLDTAAIAHRVEKIPAIASAEVATSFPSTVTITVTERVPVGYTRDGARVVLIDRDGVQYPSVSGVPSHLPHFVLASGAAGRASGAALAVVASALPASLRAEVITVQARDPEAITLALRGGTQVDWGDSSHSPEKARILGVLLKKHPSLIDVTDPGQPFTR